MRHHTVWKRHGYLWIILLLIVPLDSQAQKPVSHPRRGPAPSWVQPFDYDSALVPQKKDVENGWYMELFDEQRNLEKEAVFYRVIRKITSADGVQNASTISVGYDPSFQQLTFHSIRILRQGKVIDQLNLGKIKLMRDENDLDAFIYSGTYTAYLILDDIRAGDKIEYSYTLKGWNPVFHHHFDDILYLNSGNPISQLFIRITVPHGRKLYLRYFNKAPRAAQTSRDGKTVYSWNLVNRPAYVPERDEPSWYYGAPYIQLTTDSSWQEVADRARHNMRAAATGTGKLIEAKIARWAAKAGKDTLEYVRLATRFVQDQIRYMGIETGPYSRRPHPPAQVMRQRYGDCKDKSLLLCTLLRARNIDADVALVSTTLGFHLPQYLPSPGLFDHAIVTFTLSGVPYWIDPTIANQRGEIRNIVTPDYGYVLVIRKGADSLQRMNVVKDRSTSIQERFVLAKEDTAAGSLAVTTTYEGGAADDIRGMFKVSRMKDIQKYYLDYYNQLYHNVSVADSMKCTDDTEKNEIIVHEKYRIARPWTLTDSSHHINLFQAYAKCLSQRLPDVVTPDRKAPLSIAPFTNFFYSMQVVLPVEGLAKTEHTDIRRAAYYYSFDHYKNGDTAHLDYIFQTFSDHITPASFTTFNDDISKIKNQLLFSVTLNTDMINASHKISWLSLILALISAGVFAFFARKVYRLSMPVTDDGLTEGRPIGGLLFLIMIGLCITPAVILFTAISGDFFSQAVWMGAAMRPGLTIWVGAAVLTDMFLLIYSVLLLFLFFKRRDTLPRAIILMFVISICTNLLFYYVAKDYGYTSITSSGELTRSLLAGLIWIPYFLFSTRVKETFVYPYGYEQADESGETTWPNAYAGTGEGADESEET